MTARKRRTTGAKPEALAALLGLAPRLPGAWQTSSSNILMQPVTVLAVGIEWRVQLHAYAVRSLLTDVRKVEVAVGMQLSTDRLTPAQRRRLRADRWQQRLARQLATLGYSGEWQDSPDGPFAYFKKQVRGTASVPAAVKQLQRVRF